MPSKKSQQSANTLMQLKETLENEDLVAVVNDAKISNPSAEVESALTGFLTSKLEKLARDDEFSDLIKMHIRQRLPEASFEELMKLSHDMSIDHTKSMEAVLGLFKNETSGKNIIDNLRDNGVSSTAQQLYDSTDSKDILQAVSYLSQILSRVQSQPIIDVTEDK